MQTAMQVKTRVLSMAAAALLAGSLMVGAAGDAAAGFNARQIESLDGGGGALGAARMGLVRSATTSVEQLPATGGAEHVGVWRGGRYVGPLPE